MFTTLQLLHRLARHTRVPDIAELSLADRLELLDAANGALSSLFALLPAERRQSPVSYALRAPLTQRISILEGATGFAYVAGNPYPAGGYANESALVGHAVSVPGDNSLNMLLRTGELLRPHLGEGGTNVSATFWGDAVQMSQDNHRVLGDVIWSDGASSTVLQLMEQWQEVDAARDGTHTGTPRGYYTRSILGTERSTTPMWLLKVWPLPASLGEVSFVLETGPVALTLEDFATARSLPITDREVSLLSIFGMEALLPSRLLAPDADRQAIQSAAARARDAISSEHGPHHSESAGIDLPINW